MTHASGFPRGLYGITPDTTYFEALHEAVTAAALGGMKVLQWRQKQLSPTLSHSHALAMAQHCRQLGVVFIINDDVDLAIAVGADGVHLGKDDGSARQARERLGPGKIIGRSCYNELDRAKTAIAEGVDYVAFGAVFASSVKPEAARAPLALFTQVRALFNGQPPVALVAIGGITADNANQVVSAGADSLAVIGGLFDQPDVRATAARFAALF